MNINKHNCEAFFLDYYEGNLSEGQVTEMFAFLKANPDQREIFESFSDVRIDGGDDAPVLPPSSSQIPDFSFLKKAPVVDIHEQAQVWMVDSVEGTISDIDKVALENYLNENPAKRADLAAFEQTVLRADESETFSAAFTLKKDVAVTPENFEHFAIALIEGTISPEEKSLLESFVLSHPEFSIQLDAFKAAVQKTDTSIVFEGKESLKKVSLVVTKDNIEELLIANTEGQLAAHEVQAVDLFLASHPEFKRDAELFAQTKLVADTNETFDAKATLRRGPIQISENNFEQFLISATEGLLNGEELKAFNAFVASHPKYHNAAALAAATRLQPDMSVVYDDKDGLKRRNKGGIIWFSPAMRYAAAAMLVILLSIYFWNKIDSNDINGDPSANNRPQNTVKDSVAPFEAPDNITKEENEQYASNGNSSDSGVSNVADITPVKKKKPEQELPTYREIKTMPNNYVPVTIVANSIPNKANDDVNYSNALYASFDRPQENTQVVANNDDYITPGQLVMRWMKDKIDGTDPIPSAYNNSVSAWGNGNALPQDKHVDGIDLTQSAVNRVGQNAANGNIAMEQRQDGTYLQLWNYEVRVAK